MKIMKNSVKSICIGLTLTTLAACGGSGSDSPTAAGNSPARTNEASFSLSDYQNNAQILLEAANTVIGFSNEGTVLAPSEATVASANSPQKKETALNIALKFAHPEQFNRTASSSAVIDETATCDNSGTARFTTDDRNNDGRLSLNESSKIILNDCQIGQLTYSGSITTTILEQSSSTSQEGPIQAFADFEKFSLDFESFTERNAQTREVLFSITGEQVVSETLTSFFNQDSDESSTLRETTFESTSFVLKDAEFSSDINISVADFQLTNSVTNEASSVEQQFFVNNAMTLGVTGPDLSLGATLTTPETLRLGEALIPVEGSILLRSSKGGVLITFDESLPEGYSVVLDTDGDGTFETEVPASSLPV